MKLFSKTLGQDVEVDVFDQTQPDGQVLTIIKHYSLQDIIYNQLNLAKDPDAVQLIRENNESYPVYKCIIWDKERNRCVPGVGSAKPESLTSDIARNYADETASNRAFDRAAILYLQFPGKQLSDFEMGIFLPIDLNDEQLPTQTVAPETSSDIVDSAPTEPIVSAPIGSVVEEEPAEEMPFANAPIETPMTPPVDESSSSEVEAAGNFVIDFGKYKGAPETVKNILATQDGIEWTDKILKIKTPAPHLRESIEALRTYRETLS